MIEWREANEQGEHLIQECDQPGKCHSESYGGHHAGDRTAHMVLQSGFHWPTLLKDARKFVLSCDESQRIGNISRFRKCLRTIHLLLNHLMFGALIIWNCFLPLMGIDIF